MVTLLIVMTLESTKSDLPDLKMHYACCYLCGITRHRSVMDSLHETRSTIIQSLPSPCLINHLKYRNYQGTCFLSSHLEHVFSRKVVANSTKITTLSWKPNSLQEVTRLLFCLVTVTILNM